MAGKRATGRATTPAVALLVREQLAHVLHEYVHDPRAPAYGPEAAEALGVAPERVFKTLLVALDGDERRLAVAILPVGVQLVLKRMAGALGARSAVLADHRRAERATGYVVGGISPLGQRSTLPTVLDSRAFAHDTIYVSGGRRGLEIELSPMELARLTGARRAPLSSACDA